MKLRALLSVSMASTLGWAAVARADVAPPRDYVEECTVDKQRSAGEECISRSSWFGDKGAGAAYLKDLGFCKRCQTWGASTWTEVVCRDPTGKSPLPADWMREVEAKDAALDKAAPKVMLEECPKPAAKKPSSGAGDSGDGDGAADGTPKRPKTGCACVTAGSPASADGAIGALLLGGAALVVANRRRRSPKR